MTEETVVDIDFYHYSTLHGPLQEEADKQGFSPENNLFAVKTIIGNPPMPIQYRPLTITTRLKG